MLHQPLFQVLLEVVVVIASTVMLVLKHSIYKLLQLLLNTVQGCINYASVMIIATVCIVLGRDSQKILHTVV